MMAKRGGFTGMPGNMNNLMKQAQRIAASNGRDAKRNGNHGV